jgi:hypothetical protein
LRDAIFVMKNLVSWFFLMYYICCILAHLSM